MQDGSSPYILVVVDMQDRFSASTAVDVHENVKRLIRKAMQDEMKIIFLEFSGYGNTNSSLLDTVEGYSHYLQVWKNRDDGSIQVLESFHQKDDYVVCGVNTPWCVYRTAYGLLKRTERSRIHLVENASNDPYDHEFGLARFAALQAREEKRVFMKRLSEEHLLLEESNLKVGPELMNRAMSYRELMV